MSPRRQRPDERLGNHPAAERDISLVQAGAAGIGPVRQQANEIVEPFGVEYRLGTEDKVTLPRAIGNPCQYDFGAGQPPAFDSVGFDGSGIRNGIQGGQRDAIEHLLQADDRLPAL